MPAACDRRMTREMHLYNHRYTVSATVSAQGVSTARVMTYSADHLRTLTVEQLWAMCPHGRTPGNDHQSAVCYELWRRAFNDADEEALQRVIDLNRRLVAHILSDFGQDEHHVLLVFIKLWRKYHGPDFAQRFPTLAAIMAMLRKVAATTRIDIARHEKRHALAEEFSDEILAQRAADPPGAGPDAELRAAIWRKLKDDLERLVFVYTYEHQCKPADIAHLFPDRFTNAESVSKVKERILKRLGDDNELRDLWSFM